MNRDPGASNSSPQPRYLGRFAPSPTGPLHFGSLVTALASYLEARRHHGGWQLRIENIDPPREMPGAIDRILHALELFGFEWTGPVVYQSTRLEAYQEALMRLEQAGRAYPCACTRREVRQSAREGLDGPVYPGTCRAGLPAGREGRSIRVRTDGAEIEFADRFQGALAIDLEQDMGDFVVLRADGHVAYHLASAMDDGAQEITHVVRGVDLLYSTPRHIHLMKLLGLQVPEYAHLPVVLNRQGQKLSKQTGARELDPDRPVAQLHTALVALGQRPPAKLKRARLQELWQWAEAHWDPAILTGVRELQLPE